MAVGCGAKFAKVMLIIFNIIFLCSGIVLMAFGIWLLVTSGQTYGPGQVFNLAGGSYLYKASAILLIAMGSFIVVVTIIGLVGAIRESKILLTIYFVLLFIVFGGEVAGGVVAIVYKDRILFQIRQVLTDSLNFSEDKPYYNNANQCSTKGGNGELWDYAQVMFKCCGVDSSSAGQNGYDLSPQQLNSCNKTKTQWPNAYVNVPLTCCTLVNSTSITGFDPNNQNNIISQVDCSKPHVQGGCVNKIQYWITIFAPVLIGIGIGFAMLEMFGFIFVVCLCMNTDKGFSRF